jgi:hypothetical protein
MTTIAEQLPSPAELELAEWKIDSFQSDLDSIRSTIKRRHAEGPAELTEEDRHDLARLVVFATETACGAENIRRDALAIQTAALGLFYEQTPGPDESGRDYWARIRDYHQREAEEGGEGV